MKGKGKWLSACLPCRRCRFRQVDQKSRMMKKCTSLEHATSSWPFHCWEPQHGCVDPNPGLQPWPATLDPWLGHPGAQDGSRADVTPSICPTVTFTTCTRSHTHFAHLITAFPSEPHLLHAHTLFLEAIPWTRHHRPPKMMTHYAAHPRRHRCPTWSPSPPRATSSWT